MAVFNSWFLLQKLYGTFFTYWSKLQKSLKYHIHMNNDQQSEDSSTRKPEAENSQPEESSTPEVAPSSQEGSSQTEDASEPTSES
jgi:hypothetical protein